MIPARDQVDDDDVTRFSAPMFSAGVVLFIEIVDYALAESDFPINDAEARQLESIAALTNGQVFSRPRGEFLVHVDDPTRGMDLIAHCMELVREWRRANTARNGLTARAIAGYGPVSISGDRLAGDWVSELPGLIRFVPAGSIGLLSSYYEIVKDMLGDEPTRMRVESRRKDVLYVGKFESIWSTRLTEAESEVIDPSSAHDLQLTVRGKTTVITPEACPVSFGREEASDHVLKVDAASRRHGRIEYRENNFHYIDQSRNGTYLTIRGGREVLIRDDGLMLIGEGIISPGVSASQKSDDVIQFKLL